MKKTGWFLLAVGLLIGLFIAVAGLMFAPGADSKVVAVLLGGAVCVFAWLGVNVRAEKV